MRSTKAPTAASASVMKTLSICLVFALNVSCSLSQGVVLSGSADYVSTRIAINSGKGVEANPVMGDSAWRQGLIKSFGIGAVLGSASLVEHKGHQVLSRIIKIAAIGVWSFAAVSNYRIASQ